MNVRETRIETGAAATAWDKWGLPLLIYYCTTLVVVIAAVVGYGQVDLCTRHLKSSSRIALLDGFAAWDGQWYQQISTEGYAYNPHRASSVAFFPAYPLTARALSGATGLPPVWALLVVSHVCLAGCFVLLAAYVRRRVPGASRREVFCTLLCFGLFPTTFFFRMAYTESLFVLLVLAAFYGMARHWPAWSLILIVGLATATRSVGIVLLVPLAMHLLSDERSAFRWRAGRTVTVLPLAAWGLILFMTYQWRAFDEPLAFVKTQSNWSMREWPGDLSERTLSLVALDPVADVYDAECVCWWGRFEPQGVPTLNFMAINPLYFAVSMIVIVFGAWKRWLSAKEWVFAALLLVVPYVTHAYQTCMASQARYAAVVFPAYLVLGRAAARLPGSVICCAALLSGLLLAGYTMLFVNWYWVY